MLNVTDPQVARLLRVWDTHGLRKAAEESGRYIHFFVVTPGAFNGAFVINRVTHRVYTHYQEHYLGQIEEVTGEALAKAYRLPGWTP